jgi:hypothetical protein
MTDEPATATIADEAEPTLPVATEEVPAPPAGDVVPPASATPYRSALQEPAFTEVRASRLVTLWGPALSTFGVLLWSFVVMGQLVTTFAPGRHEMLLGEGVGVLFVLGASGGGWVAALRQSLRAAPATGLVKRMERGIALGILAVIAWCAAMAVAMIVGRAAPDGIITILLLIVASASFLYARRVSLQSGAARTGSVLVARALWAGAGLVTFAALFALAAD